MEIHWIIGRAGRRAHDCSRMMEGERSEWLIAMVDLME